MPLILVAVSCPLLWCIQVKHSGSEARDRRENGSCSRTKWPIQINGNCLLLLLCLV